MMTVTTVNHGEVTVMSRVLPALQHEMSPHFGDGSSLGMVWGGGPRANLFQASVPPHDQFLGTEVPALLRGTPP